MDTDQSLFDQLTFFRYVTLQVVKDINEATAKAIPEGFNNNILWNLGHLYSAQEQFAFGFAGEPTVIPEGFRELFGKGTKPNDWKIEPPALDFILTLLEQQPKRIREGLEGRLNEVVGTPFAMPGITLKTIGELLTFNLYHEGIHVQAIRTLIKLNQR